jgi:hypothetical protein
MTYSSVVNYGGSKRTSPQAKKRASPKAKKRASPKAGKKSSGKSGKKSSGKGSSSKQLTTMRLNPKVVNTMLVASMVFQAIVLLVCIVDSDYLDNLKNIFEGREKNPDVVMVFISPVIMLILSVLILVVRNSIKNPTVLVLLSLLGVCLSITFMIYAIQRKENEGFATKYSYTPKRNNNNSYSITINGSSDYIYVAQFTQNHMDLILSILELRNIEYTLYSLMNTTIEHITDRKSFNESGYYDPKVYEDNLKKTLAELIEKKKESGNGENKNQKKGFTLGALFEDGLTGFVENLLKQTNLSSIDASLWTGLSQSDILDCVLGKKEAYNNVASTEKEGPDFSLKCNILLKLLKVNPLIKELKSIAGKNINLGLSLIICTLYTSLGAPKEIVLLERDAMMKKAKSRYLFHLNKSRDINNAIDQTLIELDGMAEPDSIIGMEQLIVDKKFEKLVEIIKRLLNNIGLYPGKKNIQIVIDHIVKNKNIIPSELKNELMNNPKNKELLTRLGPDSLLKLFGPGSTQEITELHLKINEMKVLFKKLATEFVSKLKACVMVPSYSCSDHLTSLTCNPFKRGSHKCKWESNDEGGRCVDRAIIPGVGTPSGNNEDVMNLCIANNVNTLICNFILMTSLLRSMIKF